MSNCSFDFLGTIVRTKGVFDFRVIILALVNIDIVLIAGRKRGIRYDLEYIELIIRLGIILYHNYKMMMINRM